ncbi:flagellar basal body rod protein FlgB [Paludibacterium paludis]|uniref:Flagellar basal body rod protein FlgB n=1 Tax=Paludibacterium paludis TaxID=1225769 RepID=A0A918P606_9NEIS|nr:flagellar basal body protein [Paludibacterium paludis]GGY28813.1 hypothetical protein GCM10011289_34980 [Paludibacterium paludis]
MSQLGQISGIVMTALDGLALRQQVIAENIANMNTPGYTPRAVDFEAALGRLRDGGASGFSRDDAASLFRVHEQDAAMSDAGLGGQVAMLADTVLKYQVLLKGVNRQLGLMQLAISEGKRG